MRDADYCNRCSRSVVCLSVRLSATCLCTAKTAERIEYLFRVETPLGPRNFVLNGWSRSHQRRGGRDPMRPSLSYFGDLFDIMSSGITLNYGLPYRAEKDSRAPATGEIFCRVIHCCKILHLNIHIGVLSGLIRVV